MIRVARFSCRGPISLLSKQNRPRLSDYESTTRYISSDASAMSSVFHKIYLDALSSSPVTFTMSQLCQLHDYSGASWALIIPLVTLPTRVLLMLPAHITAQKTIVKRAALFSKLDKDLVPHLKKILEQKKQQRNWSESKTKSEFQRIQRLLVRKEIIEQNCSSSKQFLPFYLQIPIWISMSLALRRMSSTLLLDSSDVQERYLQFSQEGALWISNLCVPDQTMIIPLAVGFLHLLNLEIATNNRPEGFKGTQHARYVTNCFRFVAIAMIPISASVPAGISMYWAFSAFSGVVVSLTMMSPKFRKLVRMPVIPGEVTNPYQRLYTNMRKRLKFNKADS